MGSVSNWLVSIRLKRLVQWCQHAFAVDQPAKPLTASQTTLIEALANGIVRRELTTPAILAIESTEPLAFVGSQLAIALTPIARLVVDEATWKELLPLLERRDIAQRLLLAIEAADQQQTQQLQLSKQPKFAKPSAIEDDGRMNPSSP